MGRMPYLIKEGANQQPVIVTRGGEFAVPEVSAIVLDHVRNVAKKAVGQEVSRAVVTVPASFTDAQRSATATAGAIAGITVVRVLNEPTAAALAYGHQRQLSRVIAVYDFGGGTFDVTILRLQDQVYEVLATAGDSFLGGDDIDEVLMQHMAEQFLATQRFVQSYAHMFEIPSSGSGALTPRIDRFVASRGALWEAIAPVARLGRSRAFDHPGMAGLLGDARRGQAAQAAHHFDPELSKLGSAARDDLVAAITVTTSFESWDIQLSDLDRTPAQIRRTWRHALQALLAPGPPR
jgi:hypothetical protein